MKIDKETFIFLVITIIILISLEKIFLLDSVPKISDNANIFYDKDIPFTILSQNLIFFIALFLSSYSIYSLTEKFFSSKMAKFYTGLLYMINPFVYIRILAGHWYLLFAYAILPLSIKSFIELLENNSNKNKIKFIILVSIVAFSIHMIIMTFIIFLIMAIFWIWKYREIKFNISIIGVIILLNSYWIIPTIIDENTILDNIGEKDYQVFSPKGDIFTIVTMYGFWRIGYIYAKDLIPYWQIFYLIILGLSIFGFISYYKDENLEKYTKAFALIGIIGIVLALGTKGPLYFIYDYDNIILKGFRDSHKFVVMLVLSYSILGGLGINKLEEMRRKICISENNKNRI